MSTSKNPLKKLTHVRMSRRTVGEDISQKPTPSLEENSTTTTPISQSVTQVDTDEVDSTNTSDGADSHTKKSFLPNFLSNKRFPEKIANPKELTSRALAVIEKTTQDNPNSFGSIFTREHQEISGIQRVFKKSIAFLIINLILFALLCLVSLNLVSLPISFVATVAVFYIVSSCLFYIILADRSYLWLNIFGTIILLLLTHSFLGLGFTTPTIFIIVFVGILIFSAYSELEKIQLGSRLFFISHIASESIRILSTVVALVLSLGLFNSMVSAGAEQYVEKNILSSSLIVDNILIGNNPSVSLNRVFMKGSSLFGSENTKYTFRDFLEYNYKGGKAILSKEEANAIVISCQSQLDSTSATCAKAIQIEEDKRILEWRDEVYPKLTYELDTLITEVEFREIINSHYLYLIKDFSQYNNGVISIPSRYIVPGIFALVLFGALLVAKFLLGFLAYILIWVVWRILRWVGFVKIEVEAVEAEIVSI